MMIFKDDHWWQRWLWSLFGFLSIVVVSAIVAVLMKQPLLAVVAVAVPVYFLGWRLGNLSIWLAAGLAGLTFFAAAAVSASSWNLADSFQHFLAAVLVSGIAWLAARERKKDKEFRRIAGTDPMTGLLNRSAFLDRLTAEKERSLRRKFPLAIAYCDCDRFKSLNDDHGHLAGDRFLIEAAAVMQNNTRAYDSVARLGGDEFAIIYPETGRADGEAAVDRLQKALDSLAEKHPGRPTFSIGLVIFSKPISTEEMLNQADHLMLEVKRNDPGRYRIREMQSPVEIAS